MAKESSQDFSFEIIESIETGQAIKKISAVIKPGAFESCSFLLDTEVKKLLNMFAFIELQEDVYFP